MSGRKAKASRRQERHEAEIAQRELQIQQELVEFMQREGAAAAQVILQELLRVLYINCIFRFQYARAVPIEWWYWPNTAFMAYGRHMRACAGKPGRPTLPLVVLGL